MKTQTQTAHQFITVRLPVTEDLVADATKYARSMALTPEGTADLATLVDGAGRLDLVKLVEFLNATTVHAVSRPLASMRERCAKLVPSGRVNPQSFLAIYGAEGQRALDREMQRAREAAANIGPAPVGPSVPFTLPSVPVVGQTYTTAPVVSTPSKPRSAAQLVNDQRLAEAAKVRAAARKARTTAPAAPSAEDMLRAEIARLTAENAAERAKLAAPVVAKSPRVRKVAAPAPVAAPVVAPAPAAPAAFGFLKF